MNTPKLASTARIDATRAILRPSNGSTRPIPCPETHHLSRLGGAR